MNSKLPIKFTLFIASMAFLANLSLLHAQPNQAQVDELSIKQGLSGLSVKHIHIDQQSQIWIETENGIDRWDGNTFTSMYPPHFPESQIARRPSAISKFAESDEFVFLFYSNQSRFYDVYHKSTNEFESLSYPLGTIYHMKTIVNLDRSGNPWVLCENEELLTLTSLTNQTVRPLPIPETIAKKIEFIVGKRNLWIRDSLHSIHYLGFDQNHSSIRHHPQKKLDIGQVNHVFMEDHRGQLYFTDIGCPGLYFLPSPSHEIQIAPNVPDDQLVVSLWEDKKHRKLIALSDQVQIVRNYMVAEHGSHFRAWNYLASRSVLPTQLISDDFYSQIFFGTHRQLDVIKFNAPYLTSFFIQPGIPTNQYGNIITQLLPWKNEQLLNISESNVALVYDFKSDSIFTLYRPEDQKIGQFAIHHPSTNTILSIFKTNDRIHDYQTELATIELTNGEKSKVTLPIYTVQMTSINDTTILILGEVKDRRQMHILYYHPVRKTFVAPPSTDYSLIASSNISYVYKSRLSNDIYFTTFDSGILHARWSPSGLSEPMQLIIDGLPQTNLISINQTRDGDYLIGTYTGLYIVDINAKTIVSHFDRSNGLSNNIVAAAVDDHTGGIWASTFSGLNFIDLNQGRIGQFHVADGIPSDEFNRNAVIKTTTGHLYFGSANGTVKIDPTLYHTNSTKFSVLFSQATIHGKNTDIQLKSIPSVAPQMAQDKFVHLDILIGHNNWGGDDVVTYYYRIKELGQEWLRTKDNKIRIDRPPVGSLTVQVKALSKRGKWSVNTIEFPFHTYIPFFSKVWVKYTIGTLLLFVLGFGYLLFDRKNIRQRLNFHRKESELELSLLQSQMNPHFIFNALGSIQYYIHENKKSIAESYLTKFANLMRMFLESSRTKFITLERELDLLKRYSELEMLRFHEKFDVEFQVDITQSYDSYLLPTMLIQPFVENAINHGLFHTNYFGHLLIQINEEKDDLVFTIQDNGIGQEAAKRMQSQNIHRHKSRAMEITQDRLDVLKEVEDLHIKIAYTDLTPTQHGHTGTRVVISIPQDDD